MCMATNIPGPAAPPPAPKPSEALKQVSDAQATARDRTARQLAARLNQTTANPTGPLGLTAPAVTTKTLLGQ